MIVFTGYIYFLNVYISRHHLHNYSVNITTVAVVYVLSSCIYIPLLISRDLCGIVFSDTFRLVGVDTVSTGTLY